MSNRIDNRNVAHFCDAAEKLGARITKVEPGSKHYNIWFVTREGVPGKTTISKSPAEPLLTRNYARQVIRRAVGRVEHVRQNRMIQNRR